VDQARARARTHIFSLTSPSAAAGALAVLGLERALVLGRSAAFALARSLHRQVYTSWSSDNDFGPRPKFVQFEASETLSVIFKVGSEFLTGKKIWETFFYKHPVISWY
jgi:hypothetical protein